MRNCMLDIIALIIDINQLINNNLQKIANHIT